MTQTIFNVGDKVQTIKTIQTLNGSGLTVHQIGTQGTVIKVHTGKLVSVTIELENGKKLTATDKDIEMVIAPVASEPTTEAAQPAHRFPVGAVVVISGSDTECTEQTGIIQERHIGRYGLLQYTVSGQQFRICESELAAL